MLTLASHLQKNDKKLESLQKEILRRDPIAFDSKCRKYFGTNVLQIMKLSQSISEHPAKILSGVSKLLTEK
jgi:hypothetical protein